MGGFGGSRFKVLYGPSSRLTKETTCVEESIAGSGTRAEPLEAAAQSVATGISTVLLWLADAICHCFLMLALSQRMYFFYGHFFTF